VLILVVVVLGFFICYELGSVFCKIVDEDLSFSSTFAPYVFCYIFLFEFKGGFIYVEGLLAKLVLVSILGWTIGFFISLVFC
jgi:hypothetical protein